MENKILSLVICCLFYAIFIASAYAQVYIVPGVPHQFYGTVTVNGNPAQDGMLIVARINGIDVAGTTTLGGSYGLKPNSLFYIEDPNRDRGSDVVEFFVSDVKAGSHVFLNGNSTELDLSITQATPPSNPPSRPSSRPPSTGGIVTPPEEPDEPQGEVATCTEDWTCTNWLDCINGKEKRVCTDLNSCGTEDEKPSELQLCINTALCTEEWSCSEWSFCQADGTQTRTCTDANSCGADGNKPEVSQSCTYSPGIAGFFLQNPAGGIAVAAFVVIIIAGLVYLKFIK